MSFGGFLRLDVRGASHARRMTFSLENFPAGFSVDTAALDRFMARRAPGRDALSTARREPDEVVFEAGLAGGVTTGATIRGAIANRDARPGDYGAERTVPRPGHADFGQWIAFGRIPTGGGKNSGRLTAPLCAAGGLCLQLLAARGISVSASIDEIGGRSDGFERTIDAARRAGDSVGGIVRCTVRGLPAGLGGALFDGLESSLSAALMAIPGAKGVEFGDGFSAARQKGSAFNDAFAVRDGRVTCLSNRQGGVMGGRTNGMDLVLRVALRPTPTIFRPQPSVDLATLSTAVSVTKGRHDPCIVRRAVPVVEALVAFALADAILADEAAHPRICLTLTGRTVEEDLAQYASERSFTDMVELRVDRLAASERRKAAEFPHRVPVPVVFTFRRASDGGAFAGSETVRERFFGRLLSDPALSPRALAVRPLVDFEEDFRVPALVARAREGGVKVIRSLHSFTGPVPRLTARLAALAKDGDIAKIAFEPKSLADVSKVFRELESRPSLPPHVVVAMGAKGLATRVLAGWIGSLWTYASVGGLGGLGHLAPHELVRDYRFRSASRRATLLGVTGWPLEKTRSPEIHNAAFLAEDEDAVMIPYPAETAREAFAFMKAMGMRGLAVTIPHKLSIRPLLDRIDPVARRIGAVNTVVRTARGYAGFNTDAAGFACALTAFAGAVRGRRVAVLGDGGAAQAVKAALKSLGATFAVFHRATPPQGFDILVNATPVDPIPDYAFTGRELVYDLGYVPETTPLMARAAKAGCRVANGFAMLRAQAAAQREIWS